MNTSMSAKNPAVASQPGSDPGRTSGMPLGARRLVLIGGLAIPVGLVAGPFLFGLQLIAVAGIVTVSVALSYGKDTSWFTGWPRLTAAAGGAWIAATVGYWMTIRAAADAAAPVAEASSVLFSTGVAAFVAMAVTVLAGTVARFRSRKLQAAQA